MKIKRLYIKNFQSIGELELFFEPNGCYHIRGAGNIGKSNIIKSIYALVRNIPSTQLKYYIKDGEETLFLEVEDFEHNIVRLSRGKEDFYSWHINGDEGIVEGTAGKVPEEVTKFFSMYEEFEKTKQVVNFRLPRAPYLFIDTTEADNYYLLQKALNIEEYLGAIKLGESQKREGKNLLENLRTHKARVTEEKDELVDNTRFLDEIAVYRLTLEKNMDIYKEGTRIVSLFEEIEAEEKFISDSQLGYDALDMQRLVDDYKELSEVHALMVEIEELENFISTNTGIIELHEQSKTLYDDYTMKQQDLLTLSTAIDLQAEIHSEENNLNTKIHLLDTYKNLNINDALINLQTGTKILRDGETIKADTKLLVQQEAEYDKAEKARSSFMRENNFCPVVMATKTRTCPFSNKSIEELLA